MDYSDKTGGALQIKDFEVLFGNIVSVVLGFAGIALFIMLLVGGFNLLTSGSEAAKTEAAKKTITYAIFGIIFVALSFLILRVIGSLTGIDALLQFKITQ